MLAMASSSQSGTSHVCFICEKSLKDGDKITVKERGVRTLYKSSIKRGRTDHTRILVKRPEIQVHNSCSKMYNNERISFQRPLFSLW